MKKVFWMAFAIIITFGASAQNQKEVSNLLEEYEQAMVDRQWAKSLDYVYPALFDVVPREMMEEAIKSTFNDTSIVKMGFQSMELLEVSEVFQEESMTYSFADYSMVMTMTVVGEKTPEEVEVFRGAMAMQFGEDNVKVEDNVLYITADNRMAVLRKTGEKKLYMLELKAELKEIMTQFMSDEFMQRAFES